MATGATIAGNMATGPLMATGATIEEDMETDLPTVAAIILMRTETEVMGVAARRTGATETETGTAIGTAARMGAAGIATSATAGITERTRDPTAIDAATADASETIAPAIINAIERGAMTRRTPTPPERKGPEKVAPLRTVRQMTIAEKTKAKARMEMSSKNFLAKTGEDGEPAGTSLGFKDYSQ